MRKFEVMALSAALALSLPGAAYAWGGSLFNSMLNSAVQQGVQQATSPQSTTDVGATGLVGNIAGNALQQAVVGGHGGNSAEVAGATLLIGAALASGAQSDTEAAGENAPVAPASIESQATGAAVGGLLRGLFGR